MVTWLAALAVFALCVAALAVGALSGRSRLRSTCAATGAACACAAAGDCAKRS